jgi:NAD(P)H-dependent flavin oxidoreductase YrpB (nitropropane dioxygenase family)
VDALGPSALVEYMDACGWALARAHARTGGSASIAGYSGGPGQFDEAIADFAESYAEAGQSRTTPRAMHTLAAATHRTQRNAPIP